MCAGARTSVSSRLSLNSSNHSGRSRKRSSEARLVSLFFHFCFEFCEDEFVPEFDGNPGQQEVRSLPFCIICSLVWSIVVVYRWPTHKYIRVLCRVDRTADVSSSNDPVTKRSRSWTYTCASTFVCTSPLAVTTVVEFLDLRKVSNSSQLNSFLQSMCIDAPESVGARIALASKG